ncbi:hypothetical protein ABDK56_11440 [Sphingomonas sp. ASV193]|uniref:hypothetical protein n=1 Tax=Sphingomonas sp. ASV193 TaxID=3144405 RepID=UPI0032E8C999
MIAALALLLVAAAGPQETFDSRRDVPTADGGWQYAAGVARFAPYLSVRCDAASGRVQIVAPGFDSIDADTAIVPLPAGGWFAARDPRLDAIAFSRARFFLSGAAGRPAVAIPAQPEFARSIEDCRN